MMPAVCMLSALPSQTKRMRWKEGIAAVNQAKDVTGGGAKKAADGPTGDGPTGRRLQRVRDSRANVKDKSVPSEMPAV